ncbi:MAG: SAM-dependent DNA methyltransferase [Phycisphaerae bacterium]|nr:SAM-dependent DNA methyltransferase [Phycisphaerae bacterium]
MAKRIHQNKTSDSDNTPARAAVPSSSAAVPGRESKVAAINGGANIGFEQKLWEAADALRGSIDAGEYKHVVLGLLFLKYISDAFAERRAVLEAKSADPKSDYFTKDAKQRAALLEDRDEYLSAAVFWVPNEARWTTLQANAKKPNIAKLLDDAMEAIERENRRLKGVLPADYARRNVPAERLGQLIDLVGSIHLGDKEARAKDVLGRVYEYFLGKFAAAEGKLGGEFFTPRCVVQLLVQMLEPYKGRVFDPCCGSGGMFVQSEKFVEAHGGKIGDISVYGQESNPTTWKLCNMNLAIRGIEAHLGEKWADSFLVDLHKDLKADFILANPPFNISDWSGEQLREDARWKYGVPPVGNANYAWIQHFLHHLAPSGTAGFVMANGSLSSNQSGEGDIRRAIIEADLVDCIIALPPQLFYTTQIPVCLWFLARNKGNGKFRDRKGETLFIDARKFGVLVTRVNRELEEAEIVRIAATYHAWRSKEGKYEDVLGFCKSAKADAIRHHGHVLTPGRYVGTEEIVEEGEPFDDKLRRLSTTLKQQIERSESLGRVILKTLAGVTNAR